MLLLYKPGSGTTAPDKWIPINLDGTIRPAHSNRASYVLSALATRPYVEVAELLQKLKAEADRQVAMQQADKPGPA